MALTGVGCGGRAANRDAGAPIGSSDIVVGTGEDLMPADTLVDWVSYAEQVSAVTILDEREIPPPASVRDRKEGYIGRWVKVRVDEVFWTSPGATTPGASAEVMELVVAGWVLRGDKKITFALEESPRLEVGGRYVIPLFTYLRPVPAEAEEPVTSRRDASTERLEPAWSPLSVRTPFAVPGDAIAVADVTARGNSPLAQELSRLSEADLRQRLAQTSPDPRAAKHWDLPPYERWRAVSAEAP